MAEPFTHEAQNTGKPASNAAEFSVSELANSIKRALEDGFGYVRLRGEISGYRGPHASGHSYFALKDDKAKIEAVIWRTAYQRLKIKPQEGMEVVALGRVTTFPGSSKYQIVIETLEPAGVGALMALLEDRKKKLAAEGLFDDSRKRQRPFLPNVVGIITSPTGAVIRDMLHGFEERFPTRVIVWPVRVQGDGSAGEVAAAIRGFNALQPGGRVPRPDVLIVGRGGGSLEDLWGFNEEIVVRAAADSRIPIISAVGHETDWTLIDLVADARAPTPTKAAEWAVPRHADLAESTAKYGLRLATAMRRTLDNHRTHLKAAARGLPRRENLLELPRQRFDACDRRLARALLANTRSHTLRLANVAAHLRPSVLQTRIARSHDRLDRVAGRSREALARNTATRRARFERLAAHLRPRVLETRLTAAHDRLDRAARRSRDALSRNTAARRSRFERLAGRLSPQPLSLRIGRAAERLTALDKRATRALANTLGRRRGALDASTQLLASLSYRSILNRGYAVVRDAAGAMIRSAAAVAQGDRLDIELADGRVAADAAAPGVAREPGKPVVPPQAAPEPPPAAAPTRARPARRSNPDDQGTLF